MAETGQVRRAKTMAKIRSRREKPLTLCFPGAKDCPVIVISHGSGGSFLGHHDTAETLADAGFVVAAISHPGITFRTLAVKAICLYFPHDPST